MSSEVIVPPSRGAAANSSAPRRDPALAAQVTVVVVPRERWSAAARSLRSVLAHTPVDVPVLLIDAGTPPELRRRLARQVAARPHGTRLRSDAYLAPNRSRNLAVRHVRTPYVVFVDNDVLVAPGWLDALVGCAEATSAWAVGPLCLQGPWSAGEVHLAGGDAHLELADGHRRLVERQAHLGARVADVRPSLARRRTELAEFHTVLVRCAAIEALGGFDEEIPSFGEHTDFCLRVAEAGGSVWCEPASVVTYLLPTTLAAADLPFYVARWSPAWNRRSRARFTARWGLPVTDQRIAHTTEFAEDHRRLWLKPWSLGRLLGKGPRRVLRRVLDDLVSPWLLARARGRGTTGLGPVSLLGHARTSAELRDVRADAAPAAARVRRGSGPATAARDAPDDRRVSVPSAGG